MGEVKLDINQIRDFSKKVKEKISNSRYYSISGFEKSGLNKLIVKQIMNAVALGQDEVAINFLSLDEKTQEVIASYYQNLGFEAQFVNIENRNDIIFEGLQDLNSFGSYKEDIIKQAVGEEVFENLTQEEIDDLSENVENVMGKLTSSIPKTETKLELRIAWNGMFYSLNKNFTKMESLVDMVDGLLGNVNLDDIVDFLDSYKQEYDEDDDEDEDNEEL